MSADNSRPNFLRLWTGMTTNVICRVNSIISSDSRWSYEVNPSLIVYVDDTGFDKISLRPLHAMVFAGDGLLISQWKNWFQADQLDFHTMPPVHRLVGNSMVSLSVSLVQRHDGKVLFSSGWWLDHEEDARFAGSGAQPAKDCYVINGCSRKAVASAAELDPFTGGEIKYIELATGQHNLSVLQATLDDATQALQERGYVMDTTNNVVTPIKDLNLSASEALRAIASGAASLSAPTGLPTKCWSPSDQSALRKALEEVARQEAAM